MAEYRANDPVKVGEQRRKADLREEQQAADLKELLTLPAFRRYLWRHMNETCGLMRSCASPNGSTQSINIGMQDVARQLWAEVESVDPLVIPTMMREHYEAQK